MTMIPNVDWDQVATKAHLDLRLNAFEERMTLRQEALEGRVTGRIERSERRTLVVMVTVIGGVQLTMIGAVGALIATFLSRMS